MFFQDSVKNVVKNLTQKAKDIIIKEQKEDYHHMLTKLDIKCSYLKSYNRCVHTLAPIKCIFAKDPLKCPYYRQFHEKLKKVSQNP